MFKHSADLDTEAFIQRKQAGERLVMLTAYDATFAGLINKIDKVDLLLVGDSLGMVIQGYSSTRQVKMRDILYHSEIVARTAPNIPVIGDMPYHSFDTPDRALENARDLMHVGVKGVKIEGNKPEVVRSLVEAGIPVMGHLGLLPQTAEQFKVQGKDAADAEQMKKDALELEEAGVFSLVLECIPRKLAAEIGEALKIPTIGIGAGPDCDGQVLVLQDMLGLTKGYLPKFVKQYVQLGDLASKALSDYADEVKQGTFPTDKNSYH